MRTWKSTGLAAAIALYAGTALAGQHAHPAPVVPHPAPVVAHPATHAAAPTTAATTHASTTAPTTTTAASAHTGTHTYSPVATRIASHPQLASRVTALLPHGMTLSQAARGFRNQGQFIAALHVSRNLGIPFTSLKEQMVNDHQSLGQAIQTLKPGTNGTQAADQAEHEADTDTRGTTSTSGSRPGTTTRHGTHP